ncbi:hypothetical protein BDV30DRAFT_216580 [Aspergillus minisclerotigenes]|uniref:Uncharacterized protein n=1 Tax=Aspergillus minisclerotigenes TaxID=656917 RepID=A0A5N6IUJ6_9EURO|nr:hypothetical protein BDV30DRAFT_216580 [Aspergillus minisclerotigenes]
MRMGGTRREYRKDNWLLRFFFSFTSQLAVNVVPAISLLPSPLICLVGTFCSLVSRT